MGSTQFPSRFLVWGEQGWIGGKIHDEFQKQGLDVHGTTVRMEDQAGVHKVLDQIQPTHVINCAGKTGRPNVDWCEDHKRETIKANVMGTMILAEECAERNIHLTIMATGCIYRSDYNSDRTQILSPPFTEDTPPNFNGSYYSRTKAYVEDIIRTAYPDNTLILRLRMPVSDDLHPRNFVTKITRYAKVVNVPNSNSVLYDLLPMLRPLAEHRETGVLNFTNPGSISHNEVLTLYRDIVDPSFKWENFTLEDQAHVIKADRSNCELDCTKLMRMVKRYQGEGWKVDVPKVHEAYQMCFERMKENMQSRGGAI